MKTTTTLARSECGTETWPPTGPVIVDFSLFVGSLATLNIATATNYYVCMTLHHTLILNSIQTCITVYSLTTMDREGYNVEHLSQYVPLQFTPCHVIAIQQCLCSKYHCLATKQILPIIYTMHAHRACLYKWDVGPYTH